MKTKFVIKKEYVNESPLYYHINEVVIDERDGEMVKVHDVYDGNSFWIESKKIEIV